MLQPITHSTTILPTLSMDMEIDTGGTTVV